MRPTRLPFIRSCDYASGPRITYILSSVLACVRSCFGSHQCDLFTSMPVSFARRQQRKEKTTPFGVNLMRSPVSYRAAQVPGVTLLLNMWCITSKQSLGPLDIHTNQHCNAAMHILNSHNKLSLVTGSMPTTSACHSARLQTLHALHCVTAESGLVRVCRTTLCLT